MLVQAHRPAQGRQVAPALARPHSHAAGAAADGLPLCSLRKIRRGGGLTHKQVPQDNEVEHQEAGAADDDGRAHRHAPPAAALVRHHRRVGQLAGALGGAARGEPPAGDVSGENRQLGGDSAAQVCMRCGERGVHKTCQEGQGTGFWLPLPTSIGSSCCSMQARCQTQRLSSQPCRLRPWLPWPSPQHEHDGKVCHEPNRRHARCCRQEAPQVARGFATAAAKSAATAAAAAATAQQAD